jgi:predicted amidohydrolase YtcJ
VVQDGRIEAWTTDPPDGACPLLDGAVVLPAFVDEHVHLLAWAASRCSVDLSAARTLGEVFDVLRDAVSGATRAGASFVRAWGIGEFDLVEQRLPTVAELDALAGPLPLVVHHRTGHATVRTTAATARGAPDAPPSLRREQLSDAAGAISGELSAAGVVELCDATATNDAAALALLAGLPVTQRIRAMIGPSTIGPAAGLLHHLQPGDDLGGVRVEAVKIMPPSCGLDRVAAEIRRAHRGGLPVAVHAVDVDELEAALDGGLRAGDRVEHAGLCLPEQLDRLVASGASVVTQPTFVTRRAMKYRSALSEIELDWLYRIGSFVERGVNVRFSSDAPVVPAGPLEQIAAAAGRELSPAERVDVATALTAVTRPGTAGERADLVVLSGDPLTTDPGRIGALEVLATWRSGRLLHGDGRRWPSAPGPSGS